MDGPVRIQEGDGRAHRPALPGAKRADLRYTAELVASSELAAVIDGCYPLERIADAYRHVDAGHKKGNVIVTMTGLGAT